MPLVPRPELKSKTILEIPTGYTSQPPTGNREKKYFTFHFANSGKGTDGKNVALQPAFMLSGLSVIYPNQTRQWVLKEPFFCLALWCLHFFLFCVSFCHFTLLFIVIMFVPKYHLTCRRVKDLTLFESQSLTSVIPILNFFWCFFPHFDAVPPNSTQIQPQSFLRVLWKPIMFPTLMARQWPRVVGVYCYDHSTNAPRQRSSADVHSNVGSSLRPSQSSIFSHHWFKAVTGELPIRSRYSVPH